MITIRSGADKITHACERFLVLEVRLARGDPFVSGYNLVLHG
jgi:hypothetical protein